VRNQRQRSDYVISRHVQGGDRPGSLLCGFQEGARRFRPGSLLCGF